MGLEIPCKNHPEREAKLYCMKNTIGLCEECLSCQQPGVYCKFRTQCLIWEVVKHGAPWKEETSAAG
ncbi:MAG: hypothetical protein JRI22_00640 [Deltaproteobacteria bacterium]|nr:hypothetical protein [Deltaproteobacteria bacterium]